MTNKEPIGYFDRYLAFDVESSGINYKNPRNISKDYQIVSIGIMIVDAKTFKVYEKLYLEIKWNGTAKWSPEAEAIHGLSKKYLEKNGITEEDAVMEIGSLIMKYFPMGVRINCLGHNVAFDILFLTELFHKFDLKLDFASRHCDTFTLINVLLNEYNSEDGFQKIGLNERKEHNSLEDIELTVETVRRIKLLWNAKIGI